MMLFLLGAAFGSFWMVLVVTVWQRSNHIILVDRWWLQDADMWAWLREYELAHSGEHRGGSGS